MSKRREADDPVVYRIDYSLIAQSLHGASEGQASGERGAVAIEDQHEDVREVIELIVAESRALGELSAGRLIGESEGPLSAQALELIGMAARELRALGWRWVGGEPAWYVRWARRRSSPEDAHLGGFLDRMLEPAAVVLYWSCLVQEGEWRLVDRVLQEGHEVSTGPWRAPWRRLRCGWRHWLMPWRRRRKPSREPAWQSDRRRWRRYRHRLDRRPFVRRWQPGGRAWLREYLILLVTPVCWQPPPLARFLAKLGLTRMRPAPEPEYRVHYNLACLYARLSRRPVGAERVDEYLWRAREQLDRCLAAASGPEEDALRHWSLRDPALKPLRSESDTRRDR